MRPTASSSPQVKRWASPSTRTVRSRRVSTTSTARRPAGALKPLTPPAFSACRSRAHDDARRRHRAVRGAYRDRHHQPRDLPDRDAAPARHRAVARSVGEARGLEPSPHLHARRRLHQRLVPPGLDDGRRGRRRDAAAGLRRRLGVAERVRQQLQRSAGVRDHDDGQGALHRGLRSAALHDWLGVLRRVVSAAADGGQLPWAHRRHHPVPHVPGRRVRHGAGDHRRTPPEPLLQFARHRPRSPRSRSRRSPGS